MRIAILGGGLTGLTAALDLSRKPENSITVYESESRLGGLASGFRGADWEWELERAYHHIFSSDKHIISFLKEIGYDRVVFKSPTTASLYEKGDAYSVYAVDSPLQLLRFPLLSIAQKIRAGMVLGAFKISPYLPYYEKHTTEEILRRWMGENAYETLFGVMFRKKFGKYAGNILSSFIWSRVHMRTKSLGYMQGGFQDMIDFVANQFREAHGTIHANTKVSTVRKTPEGKFTVVVKSGEEEREELFDRVISTLPSPVLASVGREVLSTEVVTKLRSLKYLSAANLIIEMEEKVFDTEYWISICTPHIPSLVFVQHTNFVDKSHYNNHNLLYIASYCEPTDPLMSMTKEQMLAQYTPTIEKMLGKKPTIHDTFLWKAGFAQPIFDKEFLENVPHFTTSDPHFFIANLDMTYPYDRGTNYAVKLGRDVAKLVQKTL
jgi:protoporphyrinogen oxidase